MKKARVIRTKHAPAPIGPYSQAVAAGGFVFCSGQVAIDPATGELDGGGCVEKEVERVLSNLVAVLAAAGCSPRDVVKTTVWLKDMADFQAVNAAYARVFGPDAGGLPPARATVAAAGLPKGARVEMEAVALAPR